MAKPRPQLPRIPWLYCRVSQGADQRGTTATSGSSPPFSLCEWGRPPIIQTPARGIRSLVPTPPSSTARLLAVNHPGAPRSRSPESGSQRGHLGPQARVLARTPKHQKPNRAPVLGSRLGLLDRNCQPADHARGINRRFSTPVLPEYRGDVMVNATSEG